MSKLTVSTDLLHAVAQWSYKSTSADDRLHLSVVALIDGELVATDGDRLVRVPIDAPKKLTLSIGRDHVLAAVAAQREISSYEVLHREDDQHQRTIGIELGAGGIRLDLGKISMLVPAGPIEKYPSIATIAAAMPTGTKSMPPDGYTIDPDYVAAIADVQRAIDQDELRGVRLTAWSDADDEGKRTGVMLFEGGGGTRYLIMPMRDTIQARR